MKKTMNLFPSLRGGCEADGVDAVNYELRITNYVFNYVLSFYNNKVTRENIKKVVNILIVICILFLTLSTIKAQDKEPNALFFQIPRGSVTYDTQFDINDPEYAQTKIMTGWQWNNHPRLTAALDMNFTHGNQPSWNQLDANTTGKEIKYLFRLISWPGDNPNMVPHILSNSFTYKPTISIDTNSFTPDTNDTERNIWGFQTRNITNPQVEGNKLVLTTNLANLSTPILSNPWRGDYFFLNYDQDIKDGYDVSSYNGRYWKVTINLKRRDFIGINNLKDTMPILKIKMPYLLNNDTNKHYINFNTKPDTNFANKVHLRYVYDAGNIIDFIDRGYCLAEVNTTGNEIIITRDMLPDSSDTFDQDITLTFSFITNDKPESNPLLRTSKLDSTDPMKIKQLGMEVYYLGNCDILLNYIRVGNPLSDKMWKGELDTTYQKHLQVMIDTIHNKGYRLFRFYGRDEIENHYELWDAMRYFNKLVGGMAITEGNSRDPRYLYRAEADYTWFGSLSMGRSAVPHFRRNENEDQWIDKSGANWKLKPEVKRIRMNSKIGYLINPKNNNFIDTLSNAYELTSNKRWFEARKTNIDSIIYLDISSYNTYDTLKLNDSIKIVTIVHFDTTKYIGSNAINWFTSVHLEGDAPQWAIESNNFHFFTLEEKKKILYSGAIWWQNYFNFGEWIVKYQDDTISTYLKDNYNYYVNNPNYEFYPYMKDYARPFIGEETRWSLWRTLIYGGKGFAFDGQYTQFEMSADTLDSNKRSYSFSDVITTGVNFDETDPNLTNDNEILYGTNQKLGYDFIPENEDQTHFQRLPIRFKNSDGSWSYSSNDSLVGINRKEVADSLGCKEDRIYIGRQSNKTEMKKFFNFLANDTINSTLFDLRLAGAISNGIRFFQSWDEKLFTDNPLKKFIKYSEEQIFYKQPITADSITLPSPYIKSRPLNRVDNQGNPFYEAWDSTQFDLTLLRHKDDADLTSGTFYIGVQNRKISPLFLYTVPSDTSKKYMKFLSTAEFDKLCNEGGPDPEEENSPNYTAEHWRNYCWQKLGCREITIPFNYEKPGTHDKVLLRVEELLAEDEPTTDQSGTPGSTPEWWRQERWKNAVKDTVIRSDGELVLKMLPGEGKMFKVTIEKTQDIVGELANSNQTKIIAYPAHQTSNQDYSGHDDSVYYHMVFHRKNPQTNKYNVYYTRSQHAYLHNTNTKTIQWRPEQRLANVLHVSQDIEPQLLGDGLGIADTTCDCKYPTLTARYDTDNQMAKVYVVFNCEGWMIPDTGKVFIFERSFPIDAQNVEPTTQLDPIGYAYAASQLNGLMIDRWGVPTINASLNGNYYAWNDTLLGIKAGFKRPENSGYITNLTSFKFNDSTNYNVLYPSLSTFSMLTYGEDNIGLVWQETTNEFLPNASSKIYYTMLRTDQSLNIYHYAPPTVCDPQEPFFWDFTRKISDPNVLCISPTPFQTYYTFPQIYRNVESVFNENDSIVAYGAGDRVYWQGKQGLDTLSSIYAKMIDIGSYDCFNFMYPKRIYSLTSQLGQPNASQGDLNLDPSQGPFNWSDSSHVVNFIEYASTTNPPDNNSNIYQFHHNYWGFFSLPGGAWFPSEENYQNLIFGQSPIGQGLFPHLVESSVLRKAGDWKINNHIFESNSQSIKTSYKYFFKGEQESKYSYPMLKFVNVNNQKEESFSFAAISDENDFETKRILKVNAFKKSGLSMHPLDTVFSSWFKINSIRDLSFFTDGNRLDKVTLKIERKSDNRIFEIPRKRSLSNKMMMNKLHLVNGKNDSYRIVWLRNKDSVILSSDILFSPEIDFNLTDTLSHKYLGKSLAIDEQIIDLANNSTYNSTEDFELIAYPNPATDIIYASAMLPLEILKENTELELTYILSNNLGTEIERTTASSGEIVNFKTHNLASGAYFIKVEANIYSLNPLSKSKSIIISR